MNSHDAKSLFLSSKNHRRVFFQIVQEKTNENNKYALILEINCARNHQFANLFEKVVNKFLMSCAKILLQKSIHQFINLKREARRKTVVDPRILR